MTPEDAARRRESKLVNERLKLTAGFLNTLGVASFVAAFLSPTVNGSNSSVFILVLGFLIAVVLHLIGQAMLSIWRSED